MRRSMFSNRSLLRDVLGFTFFVCLCYLLICGIHTERVFRVKFITRDPAKNIRTIWFSGMLRGTGQDTSWVHSLPKLFATRFPQAKIYVVLQQRPEIRGAKLDSNLPLNIVELKRPNSTSSDYVFEPVESIEDVQYVKPDVVFVRNAYNIVERIAQQTPWLLDPSVVRVFYPVHNYKGVEYADMVVTSDSFLKPLPSWQIKLSEDAIRSRPATRRGSQFPFVKENIIFYPASLYEKKGQMTVAKLLDPKLFQRHNLTLVIAGKIYNESYWVEVQRVLIAKGIRFNYIGFVKDRRAMFDWYARSRGIIHYSTDGPGPRVVYEALYANTPYFVSPNVTLDSRILPFGVRVGQTAPGEDPSVEFNARFEELLNTNWSNRLLLFARKHLTESAFDSLFERIECLYEIKKRDQRLLL
eukprot:TRINITY_DN720_c0_g1_i1.p1 TRINITY_DN720_c0_g1~~TRINITY_DN720_c0_g1_i1.p1  ORF type:complete len:412 (-),score=66.05 TRINITY_DN720_c0_g1_i1:47-1282(-)